MNHIYYTFLAGWCADAAGARLEFRKRRFTEQEAIDAMHFIGEKTNSINEGQITDDSEMEIALLTGLLNGKNEQYFPVEQIAKEYITWRNSNPFDIGRTTMLALAGAKDADDMANNAFEYNEDSESNGSLMRCIPIAVFSLSKSYETILEIAEIDEMRAFRQPFEIRFPNREILILRPDDPRKIAQITISHESCIGEIAAIFLDSGKHHFPWNPTAFDETE